MDRRVGIEPTMFHNLAGIEPDGQLPHSTILVYLRIFKTQTISHCPTNWAILQILAGKIGLEPMTYDLFLL